VTGTPTQFDAVVIGGGFGGIYAVHKMRDDLGLNVQAFEAGHGVGGTWYWNRYPGARCDIDSIHYQFSFSEELQRFDWSERFASQPEILRYLEWVAEKLDVARSFRFNTRVTSLVWDEAGQSWTIGLDSGETCTARYVVSCVGNLSVPKEPEFSGAGSFTGELYRTSSWPHEPVDFTGKRVALIGTGSTGIQVVPEVARQAAHLAVFQRTPNYAAPMRNRVLTPEERKHNVENIAELRANSRASLIGLPYPGATVGALQATPEERKRVFDECWEKGGLNLLLSSFNDILFNEEANATVTAYIRDRIRDTVADPQVADLLCPTDYPFAGKRPPLEGEYYETFNRPNVELIDISRDGIEEITPTGLRTASRSYDVDVIILATGFDTSTAAILKLGVVGRDGVRLDDRWANGPASFLGISTAGFPNLFTICGPQSPAGLYNFPLAIEDHVDFTADVIRELQSRGAATFEATREAEVAWNALVSGILSRTVIPKGAEKGSWYMGANIPGKPRAAYLFAGGVPLYRAIVAEAQERGYAGFAIDGQATEISPLVKLDSDQALVMGLLLLNGARPLEELTLEEARATVASLPGLQLPGPDVAVDEITAPPARIYRPDGDGPFPVVVFFHPGGWVAGSPDVSDNPCRELAARLGAVVVSAGYRLAPEAPFPAATDDTFAAVQWVRENIARFGGDPTRIAVAGESAGAHLAAVAALRARDAGIDLAAQILLYPPIDPEAQTPSRAEFAHGPFLSVAAMDGMWAGYLNGAEITALCSPNRASLAGLAPALVLTCECDPTRDEAEAYGHALAAAGVPAEVQRLSGFMHAALNMNALVPRVEEIYDAIGKFAAQHLGTGARS
jgi:cation diffusion facilitator CzcD-associated flavoprotein CzcO/acetyl esterase/lipase